MSESIRIAVAMHKPYRTPDDPAYLPLHVGAALHPDVLPGIQGDDEGDNISRLNASYSELTALYWMWKNCDADYKGLVHYRRLFASPSLANRLRKDRFVRIASGKEIREALKKTGAVVPRSRNYYIETMHSHYAHTLDGSHLDVMRDILMSKAPEYVPMFDRCMASTSGHMFNMLVMRADLFDAYCAWLFPLIDELASQIDASAYTPFEKRYPGRVSELLLDVWLKTNGQDVVELPLTSPEPTDWEKRARASSWPSSPAGNTRRASDLYRQIRKESKILVHFVFYYFSLHYIFGLFCPQRYIKSCDRFHLFMAVHMYPRIIATLWIYWLFRKDNWLYYLRQRGFFFRCLFFDTCKQTDYQANTVCPLARKKSSNERRQSTAAMLHIS